MRWPWSKACTHRYVWMAAGPRQYHCLDCNKVDYARVCEILGILPDPQPAPLQTYKQCPSCWGTGRFVMWPCSNCFGSGKVQV